MLSLLRYPSNQSVQPALHLSLEFLLYGSPGWNLNDKIQKPTALSGIMPVRNVIQDSLAVRDEVLCRAWENVELLIRQTLG